VGSPGGDKRRVFLRREGEIWDWYELFQSENYEQVSMGCQEK
jgi:hypothetical protein